MLCPVLEKLNCPLRPSEPSLTSTESQSSHFSFHPYSWMSVFTHISIWQWVRLLCLSHGAFLRAWDGLLSLFPKLSAYITVGADKWKEEASLWESPFVQIERSW